MSSRLAARSPAAPQLERGALPAAHPLLARYVEAQVRGDRASALAVVDEGLAAGLGVPDVQLRIVCAAQDEIGRLWQENRLTIAEEHVATAISQLALAHLYRHLPRGEATGKKVLVACVEGELHDMGPRILADFLEMAGFDVRFVGANVPAASLVALARRERPDLVALSISLPLHAPALEAAVEALRASLDASVVLAAGGPGTSPALLARVGLLPFGRDALQAVAAARGALGLPASDGSAAARALERASVEPLSATEAFEPPADSARAGRVARGGGRA